MCRENRRLLGDQRSEHQERRASARRGNETHLQWREFFPERVRSRTTGGLRPPLLAACADVIADTRFAPTNTDLATGGFTPPALGCMTLRSLQKATLSMRHTHTHEERRASARRGVTYRRCAVRIEDYSATSEASIKSGGRQPAVGTKRICNGERVRVFPGASTFAHHGGLTPPALGCMTLRSLQKATLSMDIRTHTKSGGRQPAVVVSECGWSSEIHRQAVALIKSGGRQPAVGTKRICNGASFFPERVRSRTTGGLRPPLLAVLQGGHSPAKLRLVRCTNARFRRAASVSPPWRTKRICNGASFSRSEYARTTSGGVQPPARGSVTYRGHVP
jgi:hypothetical protein